MSKKIKFIESSHKYLTEEEEELISVSKFTERFKPKVDWDKVAANVAIKLSKGGNPSTKQDVLDKWKKKGNITREVGILFHKIQEQSLPEKLELYGSVCTKQNTCAYEGEHKSSIPIHDLENNTVYPELMIYDLTHMICGQSDKVIVVDNKIHIWDYKTDAEISFNSFSNKWVKPKKLLPPLSHLDDCNGNIYSIKMSLYMYMLWKANKGRFKPGDLVIEHVTLKRDEDKNPILENGLPVILKIEQILLPYRKEEVVAMLKTLKPTK